jgi:hypothetical protein
LKKITVLITVIAVMLAGATVALASDVFKTPAEIVSDITGKPVDEVTQARSEGVTYGAQAAAAGKLEEFKDERLEQYKLRLDEAVKAGRITQEEADKLFAAMHARITECDGVGSGAGCGLGRGPANSDSAGKGLRRGPADGTGKGPGRGMGKGSVIGGRG